MILDLNVELNMNRDSNGSSNSTTEPDDQSDDGPSDTAPGSVDAKLALSIGPIVLFSSFLIQMFPA
jgi:hypothetical protein